MLKFVRFLYKSGVVFLNPATFSAASSKDRGFTAIVVRNCTTIGIEHKFSTIKNAKMKDTHKIFYNLQIIED